MGLGESHLLLPSSPGMGLLPPRGEGAGITALLVGNRSTWSNGAVHMLICSMHSRAGAGQGFQLLAGHT